MMRQSIIQAALVLLLTVFMSHISEGGETNDAKQIDLTKQLDEIQPSLIENSEFRVARDARRKLRTRRKGNNQNQKQIVEGERKRGKVNKNKEKIKKKTRQNKMNRRKFKKKEKKNKEKNTKYKKKSTKTEKKSKPNKSKHNSEHSKKKKKKSEQKKKSRKNKKKLRKKSKNSIKQKSKKNKLSEWKPKQDCDIIKLCQKIKDFIKISNNLRKANRINKTCILTGKKANKSETEFKETVTSLETAIGDLSVRRMNRFRTDDVTSIENIFRWKRAGISSDDVTSIKNRFQWDRAIRSSDVMMSIKNRFRRDRASISSDDVMSIINNLKNCTITVKTNCLVPLCQNDQESKLLVECISLLKSWILKFGPEKGSCLKKSNCCACITALPDIPQKCLKYEDKEKDVKKRKLKCTKKEEQGSFGFCRNLQYDAAEKGTKYFKNSCQTLGGLATKGPGRSTSTMTSAATAKVTANVNPTTSTAPRPPVCTPQQCGVKKQGTKIIGGTVETVKPWTATIQKLRCGGSVIANNWIMTAAHCFYNTDGVLSITNDTIGENPIKVGENLKELKPEKLFIHLQFKYGNPNHLNDIALVKVPAIDLTPVCLPTRNNYDGNKATVYGWGSDDNFQALDVTIQSDNAARQAYQNTISPLTNSQLRVMVFAGGEKNKDACDGDDGGPLIVGNELVGIVSWGLGCGVQGLPRAYTEVSFFKDWIIEKTNICQK